ncbi:MAG: M81 family metallopeptidase, partial [Hyphomicrobiales bacterium]
LKHIRTLAPDLPVCATFDMHTNLTDDIVSGCDVLIGYKSYPHTDMYDVGRQIGEVMWDKLEGRTDPVTAWRQVPVLAQTLRMGTADQPMRGLQDLTRELERDHGILAATVFGGFPMADVEHAGASVVAIADGDRDAAEAAAKTLFDACWAARGELVYRHRPIGEAIEQARRMGTAPVILLDHADNVGSGGTSDVMAVIEAVRDAGLEGVAVAAVFDPQAAAAMHAAGEGAEVTLELGGKTAMPALGLDGRPLKLTGTVASLSAGRWVVRGPMYTGITVDTGPTAVLDTGAMKIVVTSTHHEPWDAGILSENGIDPLACRYILLKSRIHYRAGFAPIQPDLAAHFTLDGAGVTTSDNSILTYDRLRRPIFPLDTEDAVLESLS